MLDQLQLGNQFTNKKKTVSIQDANTKFKLVLHLFVAKIEDIQDS